MSAGIRGAVVLADSFGRVAADLRVPLTDRCDLRCTYCMPAEGLDWLPRSQMVTADEIMTTLFRDYTLSPDDPEVRGAAPAKTSWSTADRPASASSPGDQAVLRHLRPGPADR